MLCPNCGSSQTRVYDTMPCSDGNVYRRRKCSNCNRGFRTIEIVGDGMTEFSAGFVKAQQEKRDHCYNN